MKLRQRYVIAGGVAVSVLITLTIVLTISSSDRLYNTVWEVQGAIRSQFQMRPKPQPNIFVGQLTVEEFRQNPLFLTGTLLIYLII